MKTENDFPSLLQAFFTDRLMRQRQASPHTIASYRDTFRLLLSFAEQRLNKAPSALHLEDLDTPFIGAFLDHLEKERGNSARSRNVRLAALHSFFRYVALHEPSMSALAQRVLAIPQKRYHRTQIQFLTRPEIEALIAAPDQKTWAGRRDRTLLLVAVQTGLRVSELTGLRCEHVVLGTGAHLQCTGKGRKDRCTPLRREAAAALRAWLAERKGQSTDHLFPNAKGRALSTDGVAYILAKHVATAQQHCPSLEKKRVTPHVLRHTVAMELLQNGVDRSVIALWLGHESMETTQVYLHADMALKEKALAKAAPLGIKIRRYRPDDKLLAFLKEL
ncbi:MAG: tyrosine-type recombinase/integrase [Syntrophorhabdales bacterium]|jgi:site-specific recombinase XerD